MGSRRKLWFFKKWRLVREKKKGKEAYTKALGEASKSLGSIFNSVDTEATCKLR